MCCNLNKTDFAKKLCCMVDQYYHCVGHQCCGGIFCRHCQKSHNCLVEGTSKWWIDPDTHLESEPPDYIKNIDKYR